MCSPHAASSQTPPSASISLPSVRMPQALKRRRQPVYHCPQSACRKLSNAASSLHVTARSPQHHEITNINVRKLMPGNFDSHLKTKEARGRRTLCIMLPPHAKFYILFRMNFQKSLSTLKICLGFTRHKMSALVTARPITLSSARQITMSSGKTNHNVVRQDKSQAMPSLFPILKIA